MKLGELLRQVRQQLADAGIREAGREARMLIGKISGVTAERFFSHPDSAVAGEICAAVFDGVDKRLAGMPIGRIVGEKEFYGRLFQLGPDILEPRADSEVLIDAVLDVLSEQRLLDARLRIVDVGTGSGCLLITLLAELKMASGVGVDLAPAAVAVAEANAVRWGVDERARFGVSDALADVDGCFDLLISNPPYIRTADIGGLDREVRGHDPLLALDGGADGLVVYRRIAADINRVVPTGWMFFEVGIGMAAGVCHAIDQISSDSRGRDWKVWLDFNNHERCVSAKTLKA